MPVKPARLLIAVLGAILWIRVLGVLSGLEVMSLGTRILPIAETLGEMSSFLFVMLFFFMAAFTVAYAMVDDSAMVLLQDTYQMAFAGQYQRSMFFPEILHDDHFDVMTREEIFEWVFRFFVYCCFGILIMVALNNIFIGMMGNTYDSHEQHAWSLFVRHRAIWALDVQLLTHSFDTDKYLWIVQPSKDKDSEEDLSLHGKIEQVHEDVNHRLKRIEEVVRNVDAGVLDIKQLEGSPKKKQVGSSVDFQMPDMVEVEIDRSGASSKMGSKPTSLELPGLERRSRAASLLSAGSWDPDAGMYRRGLLET